MAKATERQVKMLVDFGWKKEEAAELSIALAREILMQAVANRKPTEKQLIALMRSGLTYQQASQLSFQQAVERIGQYKKSRVHPLAEERREMKDEEDRWSI